MLIIFFQNRNFRNFLLYQAFCGIGRGIFAIFMMWVVHFQYQNSMYTGIAGFMFAFPNVASFIAGPFVDRRSKVALIRAACYAQLCIAGLLLALSLTFQPAVWFLFIAIFVFQVANMISSPAETAYLPTIVDSDDLIKANAFIRITATIVGLSIGTLLYLLMARGAEFFVAYAINTSVLFIALVFSIFIKSASTAEKPTNKNYFTQLKDGLEYVKKGVIAHLVLVFMLTSIMGNMAYVNLPMFAEIHTGEASGYIIFTAIGLVGGILGSYIARAIGAKYKLSVIFICGFIAMGIARIIFVNIIDDNFRRALWILALYAGLGSAVGIFFDSLQQKLLPEKIIGRVSTINTSLFSIAASIGALLGGVLGAILPNVDTVFVIQGAAYIIIGLCLCFSSHVRMLPKSNEL